MYLFSLYSLELELFFNELSYVFRLPLRTLTVGGILYWEIELVHEELFIYAGYLGYVSEGVASADFVRIENTCLGRCFNNGLLLPLESAGEARHGDDCGEEYNGYEHDRTGPEFCPLPVPDKRCVPYRTDVDALVAVDAFRAEQGKRAPRDAAQHPARCHE